MVAVGGLSKLGQHLHPGHAPLAFVGVAHGLPRNPQFVTKRFLYHSALAFVCFCCVRGHDVFGALRPVCVLAIARSLAGE